MNLRCLALAATSAIIGCYSGQSGLLMAPDGGNPQQYADCVSSLVGSSNNLQCESYNASEITNGLADFGLVRTGTCTYMGIFISDIASPAMEPGSSPDITYLPNFTFISGTQHKGTIALTLAYCPASMSASEATAEFSVGAPADRVTISLIGHSVPMVAPQCFCPAGPIRIFTSPYEEVAMEIVQGPVCTDPDGDEVDKKEMTATVTGGAAGAQPAVVQFVGSEYSLDVEGASLTASVATPAGMPYVVTFKATDSLDGGGPSLTTSCSVNVDAVDALLELDSNGESCDTSEGLSVHLVNPAAASHLPASWFDPVNDCWAGNPTPNWGMPTPDDDPLADFLQDGDSATSRVRIGDPAPGTYAIGIHYYCQTGCMGRRAISVNYTCGATQATLGPMGMDPGDIWLAGTVSLPDCTVTPSTSTPVAMPQYACPGG